MTHRIFNEYLEVHIEEPSFAQGTRFDRTGFITQVRLTGGGHTFCVPESLIPGAGTGGSGLCNEFGLFKAIGYEDAAVGDDFPKIGVGLLTRMDDGDYGFHRPYPVKPYPVDVHLADAEIRYIVHPLASRGYAVRLEKTIRLSGSSLLIEYALHNIGTKRIDSHEYVHNFVAADFQPVGPGYILKFGAPIVPESMESDYTRQLLDIQDTEIRWPNTPTRPFYCMLRQESGPGSFFWELQHQPSGLSVRESGNFEPWRIALWGDSHVISPEIFIHLNVAPGETMQWERKYDFIESSR